MAVSNSDPMLFSCENKCFDAVAVIVVHWDNLLACEGSRRTFFSSSHDKASRLEESLKCESFSKKDPSKGVRLTPIVTPINRKHDPAGMNLSHQNETRRVFKERSRGGLF